MKIVPSPLVSELRGTAGGAVCATWKGRNYARRYTVPRNPRTVLQLAQRAAMADMPPFFRSLLPLHKAFLTLLGVAAQLTGFNLFVKASVMSYKATTGCPIIPANPILAGPTNLVDTGGGVSGTITISWSQAGCPSGSLMRAYIRPVLADDKFLTNVASIDAITVETGTDTFVALVAGASYEVTVFAKHATKEEYSGGISIVAVAAV